MASDFWDSGEWEEFDSKGFGDDYGRLYDDVFGDQSDFGWQDDFAKMLFDMAFVHPDESPDVNAAARDMLYEWMDQEYGIDFEAEFDWETWRELYG